MAPKQGSASKKMKAKTAIKIRSYEGKNNPFWGKRHSEASKIKMSENTSGKNNGNWKGGPITRPCNYCGKIYVAPRQHLRFNRKICCSLACANIARSIGNAGKNHWNWKGGVAQDRQRLSTAKWIKLAVQIRKRDNHVCQRCGVKLSYEVHHIIPYRVSQDDSASNLETLCFSCHNKADRSYNEKEKIQASV